MKLLTHVSSVTLVLSSSFCPFSKSTDVFYFYGALVWQLRSFINLGFLVFSPCGYGVIFVLIIYCFLEYFNTGVVVFGDFSYYIGFNYLSIFGPIFVTNKLDTRKFFLSQ